MMAPSHVSWDPRVVQRESASLAGMGHEVAVIAMHEAQNPVPEGIELLPLKKRKLTRVGRMLQLWRVYSLASGWRADVYHAHEVESLLVALLVGWRRRAKVVFDAHECFHFTAARYSSGISARLVTWLTSRVLGWMSRRAAHVVVVSYTNEAFYRQFCRCRHVTILHNSPPPDKFKYAGKSADASITLTHDGFLSVDRGQSQILEALAIVRKQTPVRLIVVGQVIERDRAAFDARVKELELGDIVETTGWLTYEKAGEALNRGVIGLVAMQPTPNNYGSLSNKLFNYMSTGQAVIGPVGSDTEKVINHAQCGVTVDMTDPRALADSILLLLGDQAHTVQLGLNARRAIEDEFGWHRMESLLAGIYQDIESRS